MVSFVWAGANVGRDASAGAVGGTGATGAAAVTAVVGGCQADMSCGAGGGVWAWLWRENGPPVNRNAHPTDVNRMRFCRSGGVTPQKNLDLFISYAFLDDNDDG